MKHTIYRMETLDGLGPFEYGNNLMHDPSISDDEKEQWGEDEAKALGWTWMEDKIVFGLFGPQAFRGLHIPEDHPHHNEEVAPGGIHYVWKVGTRDLAQFNHWFPETSYEFFNKMGMMLAIYECDCAYIHFGEYQLLFCLNDAHLVERRPLLP